MLKCPTRSRPKKVTATLSSYVRLANHPELLGVAISCDEDDASMRNVFELDSMIKRCAWSRIFYSPNRSKIQACNANMDEVDWNWDIVVLVSDDMIPQIKGYDDIIRNHMKARFPDTNGLLWFNDGAQGEKLNTLCIYGREFYKSQGFIYNPEYMSLFCDTELTDQCRKEYANRCLYVPYCIIRHEHPGTGFRQAMDKLYETNQRFWNDDMYTYIRRKTYSFDWSVLIANITGRESSLQGLLSRIRDRVSRIAPQLRVEYLTYYDNKESSIGSKRQWLLERAQGKYLSFVDDDDDVTDAYIEDLVETIKGSYPVMRLRGQISQYTFTHSIQNSTSSTMARGEEFLRPPNHLNPMMSDVAKLIRFKDAVRGEDLEWTIRLAKSGFLINEYRSDHSRIHYIYNMGDRRVDASLLERQSKMSYEDMLKSVWIPAGGEAPRPPEPGPPRLRLGPNGFVSI